MTYLVDANVLNEPTRPKRNATALGWPRSHEPELVVDSIILGELCIGVLALPPGRKRAQLERWLETVADNVDCLPWDRAVARRWAALIVDLRKREQTLPLLDGMIAATALEHGLTVATRNTRDFAMARVPVVDPFVPAAHRSE